MKWYKQSAEGGEPYSQEAEIETLKESLYPPRQNVDQALSLPERIKKLREQTYSPGGKSLQTVRPPGHVYKEKYQTMVEHNPKMGGSTMKWFKKGQKEYFLSPVPHTKGTEIKSPWKSRPEITQGKPEIKTDTATPKKFITKGPDGKIIINPRPFKQGVPPTKVEKPTKNISKGPSDGVSGVRPYRAQLRRLARPPRDGALELEASAYTQFAGKFIKDYLSKNPGAKTPEAMKAAGKAWKAQKKKKESSLGKRGVVPGMPAKNIAPGKYITPGPSDGKHGIKPAKKDQFEPKTIPAPISTDKTTPSKFFLKFDYNRKASLTGIKNWYRTSEKKS